MEMRVILDGERENCEGSRMREERACRSMEETVNIQNISMVELGAR